MTSGKRDELFAISSFDSLRIFLPVFHKEIVTTLNFYVTFLLKNVAMMRQLWCKLIKWFSILKDMIWTNAFLCLLGADFIFTISKYEYLMSSEFVCYLLFVESSMLSHCFWCFEKWLIESGYYRFSFPVKVLINAFPFSLHSCSD